MTEILDIVNEQDEIIGQADRDEAHDKGLLIRMVFILFYTPDKKVILQRRSLTKKSNPGRLTVTVSGHVVSIFMELSEVIVRSVSIAKLNMVFFKYH